MIHLAKITFELPDMLVCAGIFIVGSGLTFFLLQILLKGKRKKLLSEAEAEAEVMKKEKILQAKEKFFQLK